MIHCAREEHFLKQKYSENLLGCRYVNKAFEYLLKDMCDSFKEKYPGENVFPNIIASDNNQIIVGKIKSKYIGFDMKYCHEVVEIEKRKESIVKVNIDNGIYGIMNWGEGFVPLIEASYFINKIENLGENEHQNKYVVIYDMGKDLFGILFDELLQKSEILKDCSFEKIKNNELIDKSVKLNNQLMYLVNPNSFSNRKTEIRDKIIKYIKTQLNNV